MLVIFWTNVMDVQTEKIVVCIYTCMKMKKICDVCTICWEANSFGNSFFSELFAVCIAGSRCAHCQRELILIDGKKLVTGRSKSKWLLQARSWKGYGIRRPDPKPTGLAENTPPNSEGLVKMVWVKSSTDILGRPQSSNSFTSVSAELYQLLVAWVFGFAGIALPVLWLHSD